MFVYLIIAFERIEFPQTQLSNFTEQNTLLFQRTKPQLHPCILATKTSFGPALNGGLSEMLFPA